MDLEVLAHAVRQLLEFKERAEKEIAELKKAVGLKDEAGADPKGEGDGKKPGRK